MTQPAGPSRAWPSTPELLVLHGVRLSGFAKDSDLAGRAGIDLHTASEMLLDFEAFGWVTQVAFADLAGWTLTERGRAEDVRNLAEELHEAGAGSVVKGAHTAFEPLNARLVRACTDWQLRPRDGDRLAANDHHDAEWDARVLNDLSALEGDLRELTEALARALARFGGYDERFGAALVRARAGDLQWVAGVGIASCHAVWMELHEDLLSTLGITRGAETETA